ncbi:hypothetical protein F8M41_006641 [Gigaspora margarita]|uniref:Uncharacterized protein n=1 Tax=Gigaspora margarita TaxID=4874 RepID=A0A8H4A3Z3_GIGMA|nr:hypothetical protein F8M41_006641 [Gigaspora margarita]
MILRLLIFGVLSLLKISLTLGQSTYSTSFPISTSVPNLQNSTNTSNSINPTNVSPLANSTNVPTLVNPTDVSNPINSTTPTNSNSNITVPPLIVPYNTVEVPPNNGTWTICSSNATKDLSYSVKVVNNTYSITPNYGNSTSGASSPLVTAPNIGIIARIRYANAFKFIPSLSCYLQFVITCNQDTGNIPIQDYGNYCLDIINPAPNSQIVNVTISFTKSSVFENGGFTSANRPGGNIGSSTSKANIQMTKRRLMWIEWWICTMVIIMWLM